MNKVIRAKIPISDYLESTGKENVEVGANIALLNGGNRTEIVSFDEKTGMYQCLFEGKKYPLSNKSAKENYYIECDIIVQS